MGAVNFIGKSIPVAQVETCTITAYDGSTTYILTIGGQIVSVVGDTDITDTATALALAFNNSTHPYFDGITASSNAAVITLTADNEGFPFVCVSSKTGGSGTIGSVTNTTVSSGPHHWDTLANFDTGVLPTTDDDVTLANGDVDILFGLDTNTDALTSYTQKLSWTGKVGLPGNSFANGEGINDGSVQEYRPTFLDVVAATVKIGEKDLQSLTIGSGRIKIRNMVSGASVTHVYGTAQVSSETGMPAVRLDFINIGNDLQIHGGRAGIGVGIDPPGDAVTMGDILVHASAGGAQLSLGDAVSFDNWEQYTGKHTIGGGTLVTKLTIHGGEVTTDEDLTLPTFEGNGGLAVVNGIITAGTSNAGSQVDASQNSAVRTWAAFTSNKGSQLTASEFGAGGLIITAHTLPTERATVAFT